MENQRLLLAALLSAIILVVWNYFFIPPPVLEDETRDVAGIEAMDPSGSASMEGGSSDVASSSGDRGSGDDVPTEGPPALGSEDGRDVKASVVDLGFAGETVAAEFESSTILETASSRAVFSNRGAQLVSFQLLDQLNEAGEPLELIRPRGSDPYPMGLLLEGERPHPLNRALFKSEEGSNEVVYRYHGEAGSAEKRFRLTDKGLLESSFRVDESRSWGVLFGPGIRRYDAESDNRWLQRMASYRRGEEAETLEPNDQQEELYLSTSGLKWVGLEDNFFLGALIPGNGWREVWIDPVIQLSEYSESETRFLPLQGERDGETVVAQQLVVLAQAGELDFTAFLGAKEYDVLGSFSYGLEETVRWGMFGFLVRPLYYGLKWIHANMVANFGWAIVFITFVIKLIFFPLTHKSQKSMSKMQELNPKVQGIRNKYRSKMKDKQGRPNMEAQRQMNEEMMAVYKSAGVNPASGCFPILLQMPVFYAFYILLSHAVELRNAPWIGWIQDLSVPDPYYVLPLAMGASSIAMQKMMPTSPDPMQRRMMQLMPLMFMFFAFAFPSGLVLYWLTNNLLTAAQQALLVKSKKEEAKKA